MPFLYRQELDVLRESLLAQRKDTSSLHLFQGASGVGKTTLLRALAEGLEDEGWHVFFLSAQTADASYASLAEMLGILLDKMTGLVSSSASAQTGAGFADEFRRILAELARRAPILIVLDGLDEIPFDVWGENQLIKLAEVVRDVPGSHIVLSCRLEFIPIGPFALAIKPQIVPLTGLSIDEFQALVRQLGLPFHDSQIRELHHRIHGLPKGLELMACAPEEAFSALERLGREPTIDQVYEALYNLHLTRIFSALDPARKETARAILGFLTVLREPPDLVALSGFIMSGVPQSAIDSPTDLWCFLCDTGLVQLLALPSPFDPSRLPSRSVRFSHKSLQDFLCDHRLRPGDKTRLHRHLADAFQNLPSEMAHRNLLFHMVEGCKENPEELAVRLSQVKWGRLLSSWSEQSGFVLNDLANAFKVLEEEELRNPVSSEIERALGDRLTRSGRDEQLKLYELACRMAIALPPGPFIRTLSEGLLAKQSRDELIAIRQDELRAHLHGATRKDWGLRILIDLWPGYYPLFAIEEELNSQGILLDIVESSKEKIDILLQGKADLIATTPGCLLGAESQSIGRLRVLGILNHSVGADKILVDASRIDLDAQGRPVDPRQIANAPLFAARHSTSHMFLNWFLVQHGLNPRDHFIQEGDDYLKGTHTAGNRGMVGVVSTWEPYASILTELNPNFRVVYDSSQAPYLIVDLLVADANRATQLSRSRELKFLGDLYDQAVQDRLAHQKDVMERLYDRLRTHQRIYEIGRDGVQFFERYQMKFFFANNGRALEKIFEEVALAWGKTEQVNGSREMTSNFRRHVRGLFDPPDSAYAWLGVPRVNSPKVFISYSWDSPAHNAWIKEFATALRKSGIETILDQWGLAPGSRLQSFMEKGISQNEFVLIVCTENYKERFDQGKGGAFVEATLIAEELRCQGDTGKFIPILRQGSGASAVPSPFSDLVYIDYRDPVPDRQYDLLVQNLYRLGSKEPPIGLPPFSDQ